MSLDKPVNAKQNIQAALATEIPYSNSNVGVLCCDVIITKKSAIDIFTAVRTLSILF
jgi:hypothetical protein